MATPSLSNDGEGLSKKRGEKRRGELAKGWPPLESCESKQRIAISCFSRRKMTREGKRSEREMIVTSELSRTNRRMPPPASLEEGRGWPPSASVEDF